MKLTEIHSTNGIYVAVKFDKASEKRLNDYIQDLNINLQEPVKDLHCTLIYSRKYADVKNAGILQKPRYANGKNLKIFNQRNGKNALVMVLDCDFLVDRHCELMTKYDLTYDFPEYIPHVTLTYDYNGNQEDLPELELVPKPTLNIVEEYREELRDL